jgi:hypothetical protein
MTPGGFGKQAGDRRREALAESNPVAAGPSAGRDRVLVRQPPDRPRSTQPSLTRDETTPLASRTPSRRAGDPTSPNATTNGRKTTGYVGQAARPPRQGFLDRLG